MTDTPDLPNAAAGSGHKLLTATKDTFEELVDVLFTWIIPVILLLVGFLMFKEVGLAGVFWEIWNGVTDGGAENSATAGRVSSLIAVLVWGALAGLFWHLGSRKGEGGKTSYVSYICKPIGAFVGGLALGNVTGVVQGVAYSGAIEEAVTSVTEQTNGLQILGSPQ